MGRGDPGRSTVGNLFPLQSHGKELAKIRVGGESRLPLSSGNPLLGRGEGVSLRGGSLRFATTHPCTPPVEGNNFHPSWRRRAAWMTPLDPFSFLFIETVGGLSLLAPQTAGYFPQAPSA